MKPDKKTIELLNNAVIKYNRPDFIANDPIQIPHRFSKKQDIEIMAFFAAILAWGQRVTIIKSCHKLTEIFDQAPYDFIANHSDSDLKKTEKFVHRTFNDTDLLYFIHFLKKHYSQSDSLETAFTGGQILKDTNTETALARFNNYFCEDEFFPARTSKHIATPARNSACKRLNMYLRWMTRNDQKGVDFGLWKQIKPSQLLMPLDVHVERVARRLGLIERQQSDFKTVLELTENLKMLDPNDPVKYDFALFGLGVCEKW
jgi:uncharacterized protein (TIGR02757 family)